MLNPPFMSDKQTRHHFKVGGPELKKSVCIDVFLQMKQDCFFYISLKNYTIATLMFYFIPKVASSVLSVGSLLALCSAMYFSLPENMNWE